MIEYNSITGKYYNIDELTNYRTTIPLMDSEQFIYQVDLSRCIKLLCKFCYLDNSYCFYEYEVIRNEHSRTISYKISSKMLYDFIKRCSCRIALQIILTNMYEKHAPGLRFDTEKFYLMANALEDYVTKMKKLTQL